MLSHPMWVRGLKPMMVGKMTSRGVSHPMWVRGLKLCSLVNHSENQGVASYVGAWIETVETVIASRVAPVASYVGAWIETRLWQNVCYHNWSHPMWVRGLKQNDPEFSTFSVCRILCGCVD